MSEKVFPQQMPSQLYKRPGFKTFHPPRCHLCGGVLWKTHTTKLHGIHTQYHRPILLCRTCGAYVSLHLKTGKPMGIVANKEMRLLRQQCHAMFDARWRDPAANMDDEGTRMAQQYERTMNYNWLAGLIGLPSEFTHFAYFGLHTLRNLHKLLTAIEGYHLRRLGADHGHKKYLPDAIDKFGLENILYINEGVSTPNAYILVYKTGNA